MKKTISNNFPSEQDVEKYHLLNDMFNALFIEIKTLSKSKQETQLNEFKVKKINEVLIKIIELLI